MLVILVTGATGKVGSELVKQLHSRKVSFTALAHSEASADKLTQQGVAVRRGDLSQPDTVRAALDGVQNLFLLTSNTPQQIEIESRTIDVAKQAGVNQIVKLSVYDAGKRIAAYKTHGSIEDHLKASGVPYTLLQPNYFMQNFAASDAPTSFTTARCLHRLAMRKSVLLMRAILRKSQRLCLPCPIILTKPMRLPGLRPIRMGKQRKCSVALSEKRFSTWICLRTPTERRS